VAKDSIVRNRNVTGPQSSTELKKSRYSNALGEPTTSTGRFLDFYERAPIKKAEDDIIYTIPLTMEGRPDLISNLFYSTPRYMWVILIRNNIDDPFTELLAGGRIFIPSITRLFSEILK
jgi:hypothetical protein